MTVDGSDPEVFSLELTAGADGWSTVSAAGEIDLATAGALVEAVRKGLAAGGVVIDLRDVTFMDSAGVDALNTILGDAAEQGQGLRVLAEMHPHVVQVLEMTGMLDLLPIGDRP